MSMLPSEYQEIPFLQSFFANLNYNWVSTLTPIKNETNIEIKFEFPTNVPNDHDRLFGTEYTAEFGANGPRSGLHMELVNAESFFVMRDGIQSTNIRFTRTDPHIIKIEGVNVYLDEELVYTFIESNNNNLDTQKFCRLFSSDIYDRDGRFRIYYCKMWENEKLIRHFIPAIRVKDNTLGMYDLVKNIFSSVHHGNVNGKFITGPIEIPFEDCEQLGYIQSTGTQSLETLYFVNKDTKIECELRCDEDLPSLNSFNYSGSCVGGNRVAAMGQYESNQGVLRAQFRKWDVEEWAEIPYDNDWHTYYIGDGLQKIDEVETNYTFPDNFNFYDTYSLSLFRPTISWVSNYTNVAKQSIKYCKIWEGEELVRNLVPVRIKSNGLIGMYDLIENKFYFNNGNQPFEYGELYQPVEYLHSTSNSNYFNTNYCLKSDKNVKFILKFKDIDITTWENYFGSPYYRFQRNSAQSNIYNMVGFSGTFELDASYPRTLTFTNTQVLNEEGEILLHKDPTSINDPIPIKIFSANRIGENLDVCSKCFIYYFQIYENDKLVHDYIPVCRTTDNKPGMFDRVEQEFLENQAANDDNLECGNKIEINLKENMKIEEVQQNKVPILKYRNDKGDIIPIKNINVNDNNETGEWRPQVDWWNIEKIVQEDTEDYPAKIGILLTDERGGTIGIRGNNFFGAEKIVCSDGQIVTENNVLLTVGEEGLKKCSKGYNTWYVIMYLKTTTVDYGYYNLCNSFKDAKMIYFYNVENLNLNSSWSVESNSLEAWTSNQPFKIGGNNGSNMTMYFRDCYLLQKLPEVSICNFGMIPFGHQRVLNITNCPKLKKSEVLKVVGNRSAEDSGATAFNCYNTFYGENLDLEEDFGFNLSLMKAMPSIFGGPVELEKLDFTNMTTINGTCGVKRINQVEGTIKVSCNNTFNAETNSFNAKYLLDHDTLVKIINALADYSEPQYKEDGTQIIYTLSLGINKNKLTEDEIAVGTNKGWTIS